MGRKNMDIIYNYNFNNKESAQLHYTENIGWFVIPVWWAVHLSQSVHRIQHSEYLDGIIWSWKLCWWWQSGCWFWGHSFLRVQIRHC